MHTLNCELLVLVERTLLYWWCLNNMTIVSLHIKIDRRLSSQNAYSVRLWKPANL